MGKLAINGGTRVRTLRLLPNQKTWGSAEANAALRVIMSNQLTGYAANANRWVGGPEIQNLVGMFEREFMASCTPVNSCTSGLLVALRALDMPFGSEVIVTPWSMTCSASLPLAVGCVPVFADVEPDCFCLDAEDVAKKITDRTKAIIAVDLFGQPFSQELSDLAHNHGIPIIEDAAQALGSYDEMDPAGPEDDGLSGEKPVKTWAGTIGDIGVFSFNQGKHLTCGEGGMVLTSTTFDTQVKLIMNHGEAVVNDWGNSPDITDAFDPINGYNLRMTEMQAAMLSEQFKMMNLWQRLRDHHVNELRERIPRAAPCCRPGAVRDRCKHVYYVLPFHYDQAVAEGIHRDRFIAAVKAELQPCEGREWEGVPISCGYIKPIYRMPLFQHLRELWSVSNYMPESCPTVERLWRDEVFIIHRLFGPMADAESIDDVVRAFEKVWENREELR